MRARAKSRATEPFLPQPYRPPPDKWTPTSNMMRGSATSSLAPRGKARHRAPAMDLAQSAQRRQTPLTSVSACCPNRDLFDLGSLCYHRVHPGKVVSGDRICVNAKTAAASLFTPNDFCNNIGHKRTHASLSSLAIAVLSAGGRLTVLSARFDQSP